MYSAFSEMGVITESNYLFREYGIGIEKIGKTSEFLTKVNIDAEHKVIIVSNNPDYWIDILNHLPDLKVFFILIGNENYEPKPYNDLNLIRNLKHVFITLPPTEISRINLLGSVVGNFLDGGLRKTEKAGSLYREARIAMSLKNKFKHIDIKYDYSDLPLGYTNNFANKISILAEIPAADSLISNSSLEKIRTLRLHKHQFTFLGQDSGRRREVFLRSISKLKFVKVYPFESGFGGNNTDSDFTYVELLLASEFTLVPPGHLNSSNHRYTESLICGSLPVILACNSLDLTKRDHWTTELPFITRYSARSLVNYLSQTDTSTLVSLKVRAEEKDFAKIYKARKNLKSVFSK